jgi:hypothetical protein
VIDARWHTGIQGGIQGGIQEACPSVAAVASTAGDGAALLTS